MKTKTMILTLLCNFNDAQMEKIFFFLKIPKMTNGHGLKYLNDC